MPAANEINTADRGDQQIEQQADHGDCRRIEAGDCQQGRVGRTTAQSHRGIGQRHEKKQGSNEIRR